MQLFSVPIKYLRMTNLFLMSMSEFFILVSYPNTTAPLGQGLITAYAASRDRDPKLISTPDVLSESVSRGSPKGRRLLL